jgi:hypothetical protein
MRPWLLWFLAISPIVAVVAYFGFRVVERIVTQWDELPRSDESRPA